MIGANPRPYLKAWGVPIEKIETQDGAETTKRFLGIVSAPGRELNFGGVVVVSDDYNIVFAVADVTLTEREKVTVMEGPDAGRYSASEVKRSADGVFTTAKLGKIL